MPPIVKLISRPMNPMGTLYYVWEQSRSNGPLKSPDEYQMMWLLGEEPVASTIKKILDEDIPLTEHLNFVFALENVSIALREQMVRHRIGVSVEGRLGIDYIPDLTSSSWWSQSMRMLDMGSFSSEGAFDTPETIKNAGEKDAEALYKHLMATAENVYQRLCELGVPAEDARQVIPLAATSRLTWSINLKAMTHILGKRACWILQAGLWEPIISGMLHEMVDKVDPYFVNLVQPPCMKGGKFNSCPFHKINSERILNLDGNLTPCPLYLHKTGSYWGGPENEAQEVNHQLGIDRFRRLWKREPQTGEPIQ